MPAVLSNSVLSASVFQEPGGPQQPRVLTGAFPLPDGTDARVLVFCAVCVGDLDNAQQLGDRNDWTLTYGAVAATRVAAHRAGGDEFDSTGAALFVLPVAGNTFANDTVVFTPVGAISQLTYMWVIAFCIDDVDAEYLLASGRVDETPIALGPLTADEGALALTFFVTRQPREPATLSDDTGFTYVSESDWAFAIDITGENPSGRAAYNAAVAAGDLTLTWDSTEGVEPEVFHAGPSIGFFLLFQPPSEPASYNCECSVDPGHLTLADIRTKALTLSGYASQLASLPPGIREMYNGFADTAQKWVYAKLRAMETARFFTWTLEPGVRYYGIRDNTDDCAVELNRYRIIGAWIQDLNNTWWPLIYGIDPTFYTLDRNFGWPTHYEVRECIELFPAPQAAYKLYVKAHFDLLPFTDDEDVTTVPSEPVENYTIFLAKSHKGMPDARIYLQMAEDQIASLIAGAHASRRYIPGARQKPVPTPPTMVQFDD